MVQQAIILSLQILALRIAFSPGNILSFIRVKGANLIDKVAGKVPSIYIQKPLWECYVCMSSVWTIVLTMSINPQLILLVCGINFCVCKIIEADDL